MFKRTGVIIWFIGVLILGLPLFVYLGLSRLISHIITPKTEGLDEHAATKT